MRRKIANNYDDDVLNDSNARDDNDDNSSDPCCGHTPQKSDEDIKK